MCPPESRWSEGPSDERASCGFHPYNAFRWGRISSEPSLKTKRKKKQPRIVRTASSFFPKTAHTYFWFSQKSSQVFLENSHSNANKGVYVMCFCVGMCECAAGLLWHVTPDRASVYCLHYVVKYIAEHNFCHDDGAPPAPIINFCTDSRISRELKVLTVIFEYINRA